MTLSVTPEGIVISLNFLLGILVGALVVWGGYLILGHIMSARHKSTSSNNGKQADFVDINNTDTDTMEYNGRYDMIFEERISDVPFRYDERNRELTIGVDSFDAKPMVIKDFDIQALKDFLDRIEDYEQ